MKLCQEDRGDPDDNLIKLKEIGKKVRSAVSFNVLHNIYHQYQQYNRDLTILRKTGILQDFHQCLTYLETVLHNIFKCTLQSHRDLKLGI